ncbi:MAG: bifunctional metallophosphatase/5'-nucleotidase, partial [Syntrophothermus sp.]
MKNLFCFIFWLLLLNGGLRAQDTLTIVHVNDTHSTLAPMAPRTEDLKGTRGGIARAATVIGSAKMTEPNVLTLHGGDAMIGDLFYNTIFGVAELRLMNALGFDVMALGNHEFDLGPATLCQALDSSLTDGGLSIVSSNLIMEDPELCRLKSIVKPFLIKEYGNLKVGIFSLLTPAANLLSSPSPAVVDTGINASITNALTQLIGSGCNVIILMSHLGIENDKLLAQSVPGIDIIISSHDHFTTVKPEEVDNPAGTKTYIVQAGSNYSHVGKLQLIVDARGKKKVKYDLVELNKKIPELAEIRDAVDELIAEIEKMYGPVYTAKIAEAAGTFYEAAEKLYLPGDHDTPLGNLITDAFRWKTGTQVAIEAGGSLAQPIWKGPVVAADVFRA